jgi:hypothetical protein
VAGRAAEAIAGIDSNSETAATDMALAKLYAGTVCISESAISSFIGYCSAEARELLKVHWRAVEAVANALKEHKTLDGEAIDRIILEAEADATHEAEIIRRERMAAMTENAQRFQNG